MDGNVRKLRWVFITGSAIPLVAYIFWQVATLGSIDSTTFMGLLANHAGLNGLLQALREWWPLRMLSWQCIYLLI